MKIPPVLDKRYEAPELSSIVEAAGQGELGFWRDLADRMSEAVIIVTPDRRIVYANRSAGQLMEVDPSEARGRTCHDLIACPQCDCACRLFESGQVENLEVLVYVRGAKVARTFRKNARLLRSPEGVVLGGIESFSDCTGEHEEREEKQRMAKLLLQERKRSELLLGTLVEGVIALDEGLKVKTLSERMSELCGFCEGEVRGRSVFELLDPEEPPPPGAGAEALAGRPMSCSLRRKDGGRSPVAVTFLPMRYGADEVLAIVRPTEVSLDRATRIAKEHSFHGIISRSPRMDRVFEVIERTADSDARILVHGESGTGKELVCRALHALSGRRDKPFFPVNCATFTGGLLLSELFGHERGAFTGATRIQHGKLELAGHGTLVLDEVGEIPLEHQALLLRVLEDGRFLRVGGDTHLKLDARVIASTNRDLLAAVADRTFRRDLFYRLNVVPIQVPPLRERREDIALLAEFFWHQRRGANLSGPRELSPEVLAALAEYDWPGNVRELRNVIDYLLFLDARELTPEHLPAYVLSRPPETAAPPRASNDERERILAALRQANFHRARAATILGMDRTTLWRQMRKHRIEP